MMDLDRWYSGIANAETGGELNPWIRTKVNEGKGSSAFGPAQITEGLLKGAVKNKILSKESTNFVNKILLPMQGLMLRYGGKDMQPGYEAYNYGGTGNFDVETYQQAYEKLAKELLSWHLEQSKGNTAKFLRLWKSGSISGDLPDKGYIKRFKAGYKGSHYKK